MRDERERGYCGMYSFENLKAWQEARVLVKEVYLLIQKYPKYEQYALCDQIRRAVISVPSNIVEGNIKKSEKEKIHFLEIAYGSLMEVYCQIILSKDLEYIDDENFNRITEKIENVSKLLSGLKNSLLKKL